MSPVDETYHMEIDPESMDDLVVLLREQGREIQNAIKTAHAKRGEFRFYQIMPSRELVQECAKLDVEIDDLYERWEQLQRVVELLKNARPGENSILPKEVQKASFERCRVAEAQVANHFGTVLLQHLTKIPSAPGESIDDDLLEVFSEGGSFDDATSLCEEAKRHGQAVIDAANNGEEPSISDVGSVKYFLSMLTNWIVAISVACKHCSKLENFLGACDLKSIPPEIDWPRALRRPQRIPNLYPAINNLAHQGKANKLESAPV